jgi:hypothetical protein
MTWYGKNTKQMDTLLESKPQLHHLMAQTDFCQELKAYNTKLLDYITNNPALISEAITYLTVPPLQTDSPERKYKLPLQSIEMVETETTCILNGFFREGEGQVLNFDLMCSMVDQEEVLPLLAGYFFRANLCLLNNKYKETIDRIYGNPRYFHRMIGHAQHMAISNTIQLFLNLDSSKNPVSQPEKLSIKLEVIKAIIDRLKE